jgi:integrase
MQDQSMQARKRAEAISVALTVKTNTAGDPVWWATWRDSTRRRMMRSIGRAHLQARPPRKNPFRPEEGGREVEHESRTQERWRMNWERRAGRPKAGTLDERKAHAAAHELVVERELELLRAQREQEGAPSTFGAAADAWLEERRAEVADEALKRSTLRDYESMLARTDAPMRNRGRGRDQGAHIMREFERRPLDAITGEDVEAFMRKLRSRGLSPATRKKIAVTLRQVLDYAVRRGWLGANPMAQGGRQKARRTREKALVVYDLATVEKVAEKASPEMVGEVVRLAALTGLRQGELLALRWSSVNFTERSITVSLTHVANTGEDEAPKSNRLRTVPLSDQAAVVLDRVSRREKWTKKGDLVFPNEKGEHVDASWLRRKYAKARGEVIAESQKSGENLPTARFHDLRHTFGTQAARAGVPLSDIQALMGHANISTTLIYVHYQPQHDAADRLTAAFAEGTAAEADQVMAAEAA